MLASPQVYREREFVFVMFFNENREAPHVHVTHAGGYAKFWLSPVTLCKSEHFSGAELKWIRRTIEARLAFFREKWSHVQARRY